MEDTLGRTSLPSHTDVLVFQVDQSIRTTDAGVDVRRITVFW